MARIKPSLSSLIKIRQLNSKEVANEMISSGSKFHQLVRLCDLVLAVLEEMVQKFLTASFEMRKG